MVNTICISVKKILYEYVYMILFPRLVPIRQNRIFRFQN